MYGHRKHYTIFSKSATPTEVRECPVLRSTWTAYPYVKQLHITLLVFFWLSIVFLFFPLITVITSCMYQCVCLQKPSTLLLYPQLLMWTETPNKYNLENYDKGDGKIDCEWGTRKFNGGFVIFTLPKTKWKANVVRYNILCYSMRAKSPLHKTK